MSQRTTKPTIRPVLQANTQTSLYITPLRPPPPPHPTPV